MSNVESYLLQDMKYKFKLLENEKELLDIMKGQVEIDNIEKNSKKDNNSINKTILEVLGIQIKPIAKKDKEVIKKKLGKASHRLKNAWVVINEKTNTNYKKYKENFKPKKEVLYWHGSRNENWWNILSHGLLLNPDAKITGKMFGNGIYFACNPQKSIGYTSINGSYWANGNSKTGFMGLYETTYSNPLHVNYHKTHYTSLTFKNLKKIRYDVDCLYAHKGKMLLNDEICFYKEEQVNIKYLVELRN